MSLERIARRTYTICHVTGKRRYPTRGEAYREYLRMRALPETKCGKPPEDFYPCDACGGWHLTSQVPRSEGK